MTRFRICLRAFLIAIAVGLFAVTVSNRFIDYLNQIPVDIPQVESETPFYVFSYTCAGVCWGDDGGTFERVPDEQNPRIVQDRDMTQYDLGGYADSCGYAEEKMERPCQLKRDRARQFIVDHLNKKRRGFVSVGYPCADCGPTDHFFIEPDEKDQWRITIRFEEARYGIKQLPSAFELKLRRATKEEFRREGSSQVLSLLNKNGKEIRSF